MTGVKGIITETQHRQTTVALYGTHWNSWLFPNSLLEGHFSACFLDGVSAPCLFLCITIPLSPSAYVLVKRSGFYQRRRNDRSSIHIPDRFSLLLLLGLSHKSNHYPPITPAIGQPHHSRRFWKVSCIVLLILLKLFLLVNFLKLVARVLVITVYLETRDPVYTRKNEWAAIEHSRLLVILPQPSVGLLTPFSNCVSFFFKFLSNLKSIFSLYSVTITGSVALATTCPAADVPLTGSDRNY